MVQVVSGDLRELGTISTSCFRASDRNYEHVRLMEGYRHSTLESSQVLVCCSLSEATTKSLGTHFNDVQL